MKRKEVYLLWCIAVLASAPAQAVIPVPLPSLTIELIPAAPTSSETFSMEISGTWPDGCPPVSVDVSVSAGPAMWIDLILSSVYEPDCPPDCGADSSAWGILSSSVGPFPLGLYDVYVRAVDCDRTGAYERISQRIRIGTGPGNGGQQPGKDFAEGQRVVLLEDDPINGLRAGQSGTVVCCDRVDCSGNLLVSWDLWTQAKDDTTGCANPPFPTFPAGSATWVDPSMMVIGRPFDQCGTIREGLEGCVDFEADDGRTYTVVSGGDLYAELDTPGGIEFGQRLRLQGLLDTNIPHPNVIRICQVLDGDVYHPILSACGATEVGCCGGELFPGDRVTLQVDNPRDPAGTGAPRLMAGAVGTVVCCGGSYGAGWVFVSWDNWTDGVNAAPSCDAAVVAYVKNSGWWVRCDQVMRDSNGNGDDDYVVRVGANAIRLEADPTTPISSQTLTGCTMATVQTNFRVRLSVEVTATSAAGGNWTGTVTPEVVNPGTSVVEICVRGEDVDLTAVPPGRDRQLANVSVFGVPAQ